MEGAFEMNSVPERNTKSWKWRDLVVSISIIVICTRPNSANSIYLHRSWSKFINLRDCLRHGEYCPSWVPRFACTRSGTQQRREAIFLFRSNEASLLCENAPYIKAGNHALFMASFIIFVFQRITAVEKQTEKGIKWNNFIYSRGLGGGSLPWPFIKNDVENLAKFLREPSAPKKTNSGFYTSFRPRIYQ